MVEIRLTTIFLTMFLITMGKELLTSSQGCRYQTTNSSGAFSSPRLPLSHIQYCSWLITVNTTLVISLNLAFYIPNCNETSLNIYDGTNESFPLLARYCGSNATANATVISSGNNMYIVFQFGHFSRNSAHFPEFHAQHRTRLKPKDSSACEKTSLAVVIALPILTLGICIIVVIAVTVFCWRRKKQGKSVCGFFNEVKASNPSYEKRTNIAKGKVLSPSQKLAACLSHQEGLWRTNSAFCKESQNPVYEHVAKDGSYVIYRSTYNITYETSNGVTGNQLNSIQKEEQLNKPTCSEPDTSTKFKVHYADSGDHYDYVGTIISGKPF